ncbi:DUF72 domain-containing protein [Streptomyces sp. TRM43335]|uniref:DUF72 domain-containing protein n=1 Tax=Streptomyces taklimakanensis TaxID=2569853 RepID=A0A6G2BHN9_9ACTN|nr:DUF72 domain-containing protein [Streptomyces taklimakanensis]MTE21801.1 DUF72 domain-containing protein [Streptomyces taklimakanensis]
MGSILVGTCSWTDSALVAGGWYPPSARGAEGRLRHYAGRFPLVEVDATYYGLPSRRNSALWAERTPPGFVFDVKAFSLLTGHPTRIGSLPAPLRPAGPPNARVRADSLPPTTVDEVWRRFSEALEPLRTAGRLGAVLTQFPPTLRPGPAAEEFVSDCLERAGALGLRTAVEFRDPRWYASERRAGTAALAERHGAALVAVDTARDLPSSVPPVAVATTPELSVVRFHGRSPHWGTGGKEDAYRHRYTKEELTEWVPRIRALAERTGRVHVLFNNCCGDAAVSAAEAMEALLG